MRVASEHTQRQVKLAKKDFASSRLDFLIAVKRTLDVTVRLKQENEIHHERLPRMRSLTCSHVVNSSGWEWKCSMRRSNSAMTSGRTGKSEGRASSSFHSSETKASFSDADNCCTSGNFSRIIGYFLVK